MASNNGWIRKSRTRGAEDNLGNHLDALKGRIEKQFKNGSRAPGALVRVYTVKDKLAPCKRLHLNGACKEICNGRDRSLMIVVENTRGSGVSGETSKRIMMAGICPHSSTLSKETGEENFDCVFASFQDGQWFDVSVKKQDDVIKAVGAVQASMAGNHKPRLG